MSTEQRPTLKAGIGVLVAAVGIFSVLGVALFGAASGSISAEIQSRSAPNLNTSGVLSAANRPATPEDEFPVNGDSDPVSNRVIAGTSRFLGETEVARYWVAASSTPFKDLCLVTELIDAFTRLSCGSTDEFLKHGIANQAVGRETASRAYLVPDGVEAEAEREGALFALPNLVVFDAEVDGTAIRLTRVSGSDLQESTVELRPFKAADRNF